MSRMAHNRRSIKIANQLYGIEKHLQPELVSVIESLNYRQQYSEPIVNEFFKWVHQQRQRTDFLPSNPPAKALAYAHERQIQLKVFLANPHVPIDTNHVERGLRVIPMGRKNTCFVGQKSVRATGNTAKPDGYLPTSGSQPHQYLVDVLQRVSPIRLRT